MDPNLVVLLDCLEDIKTKISDNEYKIMIESLQKINNNSRRQTGKKYKIVISYNDDLDEEDEYVEYQVEISKKRQLILRSAEFDNFCRSDKTSQIFAHNGPLLEKLLEDCETVEQEFEFILYFTIFKIE